MDQGANQTTSNSGVELESPELVMLRNNKQSGYYYRYRKYQEWTENYELYRDKVQYNRLTQRQSVNLPLMKKTIKTMLKYVDAMPLLQYENLDNDKTAEIFKNEYWKWTVDQNKMELQDIIDKRQVMLFGRSFDQWQIIDGKINMTVQDPNDIFVSRYVDPFNIHSSRFLIHTHIFKPLSSLKQNSDYDQEAVSDMKKWYASKMGLIKSASNYSMLSLKNKKLADLGVLDAYTPILGETVVELTLNFVWRDDEKDEKGNKLEPQIFLYVDCDNMRILMKKPLEEVIGVTEDHYWRTHYPYVSWADDIERQDFWSDGIADTLRTPNKIINSWFAQMVENRTLRNYNMHYFNSNLEGFNPQTYEPVPWGWYGIPVPANQKIDEVLQNVEIPQIENTMQEIEFLMGLVNEASGASSVLQGTPLPGRVPLGVVQFVAKEAQDRIISMSKFYTDAWRDRGMMFIKLLEAASDKIDAVKIYKKGRNTTDVYPRTIGPSDWKTKAGYRCKVWSRDEKNKQDTDDLNKMMTVKSLMPTNSKLSEVIERKALEFADVNPDDTKEIMLEEEKNRQALMNGMGGQPGAMPGQAGMMPQLGAGQSKPPAQRPLPGEIPRSSSY